MKDSNHSNEAKAVEMIPNGILSSVIILLLYSTLTIRSIELRSEKKQTELLMIEEIVQYKRSQLVQIEPEEACK